MKFDRGNQFDWKPILEIEHPDGLAAVCADPDGSRWLARNAENLSVSDDGSECGESEDLRDEIAERLAPGEVGGQGDLINDVSVLGGILPVGASSVRIDSRLAPDFTVLVVDGVWLATAQINGLWFGESVTFWTPEGTPVVVPLPDHVTTEPLGCPNGLCLICGASNWILAFVPHREYVEGDDMFFDWWNPGRRAAVCQSCGHVEELSIQTRSDTEPLHIHISDSDDRKAEDLRAIRDHHRRHAQEAFERRSGSKPFALPSGSWVAGDAGATGFAPDGPNIEPRADVIYGDPFEVLPPHLRITTYRPIDRNAWSLAVDRDTEVMDLASRVATIRRGDRRSFSDDPSIELEETIANRRAESELRAIGRREIDINVDGRQETFSLLEHELCWSARTSIGHVVVALQGAGIAPGEVTLAQADPENSEG